MVVPPTRQDVCDGRTMKADKPICILLGADPAFLRVLTDGIRGGSCAALSGSPRRRSTPGPSPGVGCFNPG
jgi:hypothetical protein